MPLPGGGGGGGALWVKISRGAPLEVQNGTQQDLNKMVDMVKFFFGGGDRPDAENGGQNGGTYLLTLKEGVDYHQRGPLTFISGYYLYDVKIPINKTRLKIAVV